MRMLLILTSIALLAACDQLAGTTPIKDIVADSARFEGKEVRIQGKVSQLTKIPFLDLREYTVRDAGGEIAVTPKDKLPAMDEAVTVKGVLENTAIIGGQGLRPRIRETLRLPG
ncbi:MAG: hypothetical protein ACYC2R_13225 [Burkholderiales bacterium]